MTASFRSPQVAFRRSRSRPDLNSSHLVFSFSSFSCNHPMVPPASSAAVSVSLIGLLPAPPSLYPPPPPPPLPAVSVAFRMFSVSKEAVCRASFCFFAALALPYCASVRSSTASAVSEMPAEIPLHCHSFPAAVPPKTLAIVCATLLAMVAIPARALPTAFKTGRKTVPMVRTAWPNRSLMSPMVFFSCCILPVGVDARAAFMPPTL